MSGPDVLVAPVGLQAQQGTNAGNSVLKFTLTGTAPGAHTYDQGYFMAYQADVVISAAYALATMTPAVSRFTNLQVGAFIAFNMAYLRGVNITAADSATTVSSLIVQPARYTPFGEVQEERIDASAFQTAADQQTTRVTVPLGFPVDGYSFVRTISDANATPASFQAAFICGPSNDRRQGIINSGPVVVKSSAQ